LQRLSTNDVGVPGRVAYTQWLNAEGGIEADLTVMRLGEDRFLVVTSAATRVRNLAWLKRHIPENARCTVADVTGAYAVLGVMGPRSRALLTAISDADLSNGAFSFGTCRPIGIGLVEGLAARVSYAGELGWELYVPTESALPVLDAVLAAGEPLGLRPAGYHALDSLRLEKGYRHWGHDIGQLDTPLEAGLAFCCKFDKPGGFIGRDALLRRKEQPIGRRLLHFRLLDPEPLLYQDEPIRLDGRLVGRVTSGAYGHCLGSAVALGFVEAGDGLDPRDLQGRSFEIEVACERFPAVASLEPFWDPRSERLRA
ncbi:MAG: aminomethyltransferase family protein, partial [Pseudomonadota bacterium]|nr:aminomethyltransferase family protein [Pseudomonadota bacterium]